jgi:hypothetical protein
MYSLAPKKLEINYIKSYRRVSDGFRLHRKCTQALILGHLDYCRGNYLANTQSLRIRRRFILVRNEPGHICESEIDRITMVFDRLDGARYILQQW